MRQMDSLSQKYLEINNNNTEDGFSEEDSVEDSYLQQQRRMCDENSHEFIRTLARSHIQYKVHGKRHETGGDRALNKAAITLHRVSSELEETNAEFFDSVCSTIDEENASAVFRQVSQQVLDEETLNWGRVVSLITFSGRLAQWFWGRQQDDEKIEEVEDWLAESLTEKEGWIERNGGWENFVQTFSTPSEPTNWWKNTLVMGLGASLAAVCLVRTLR